MRENSNVRFSYVPQPHFKVFLFFWQDKKTPLHLSAEKGRIEVCQHLLELRADISAVDNVSSLTIGGNALVDRRDFEI